MSDLSTFRVQDAITRPDNTTAYAIGDVVGDATARPFIFRLISRHAGEPFWILKAVLLSSNAPATTGIFDLHLYQKPIVPAADNAAFAPTMIESSSLIGTITFDVAYKLSALTYYYPSDLSCMHVVPADIAQDIYGVLVAGSAYTPASKERFVPIIEGRYEI